MKVLILAACLFVAIEAGVVAPLATTLVRTPSLDSAIIQSDRLGGNFAYSAVTGHAYAAVAPVVQNLISPIGVTYHHQPLFTHPAIISPVVPGIVAPGSAVYPLVPGIAPAVEAPKPAVPEAPAAENPAPAAAPAEPAPAANAEASQSDDTVAVDAA